MIGRTNSISESKKFQELSDYYFNKIEGFYEPFSFLPPGKSFSEGAAVVLNNEIHVLGSGNVDSHFKWNGKTWALVSTVPDGGCEGCRAVVLNNEIHVLGGSASNLRRRHIKWNGNTWVSVSTLPYEFSDRAVAVVLNNEIHVLGGHLPDLAQMHYKWNGNTWVSVSTLPTPAYSSATSLGVVLDNEIRYFFGSDYYKWDGSSWTLVNNNAYISKYYRSSIVTLDDDIYIISRKFIYKWNGHNWVSFGENLPFDSTNSMVVVLNDEIYILYGYESGKRNIKYAYKINPKNFLPNNFFRATSLVLNNEIHVLGGLLFPRYTSSNDTISNNHYKWDGNSWTLESTLPIPIEPTSSDMVNSAVILNNEIHCFTNKKHYKRDGTSWVFVSNTPVYVLKSVTLNNEIYILSNSNLYKWNGNTWVSVSTLPYAFSDNAVVVLDNEIHILGYSTGYDYSYNHYKWDGSSWTSVSKLPFSLTRGNAFLLNDEIYIMSGFVENPNDIYDYYTLLYKWDGLNWIKEAEIMNYLVYDFNPVVLNDEIHIFNMSQHSSLCKVYKMKGQR